MLQTKSPRLHASTAGGQQRCQSIESDILELRLPTKGSSLSIAFLNRIRDWAIAARSRYPFGVIVMAATRADAASERLRLLQEARNEMVLAGFPRERIRCDSDPLAEREGDALVCMKVISSAQAELEIRSIRSLLNAAPPLKGESHV